MKTGKNDPNDTLEVMFVTLRKLPFYARVTSASLRCTVSDSTEDTVLGMHFYV